jgi:hypothetical protein
MSLPRIIALALIPLLLACGRSSEPTPQSAEDSTAPLLASMGRLSCVGTCPVYEVRVHSDGAVRYCGEKFVKVGGVQRHQLTDTHLDLLRDAFETADFASLDATYESDESHTWTTVMSYGNKGLLISGAPRGAGYSDGPPAVVKLQLAFDDIVGIERWIGAVDEREGPARTNVATGDCGLLRKPPKKQ